ncbi:hypothetical protein LIA77_09734 [Sarocladium implicatum]|nr:hypothetical protein LIA77_09734 [Sarocladium implicatum]
MKTSDIHCPGPVFLPHRRHRKAEDQPSSWPHVKSLPQPISGVWAVKGCRCWCKVGPSACKILEPSAAPASSSFSLLSSPILCILASLFLSHHSSITRASSLLAYFLSHHCLCSIFTDTRLVN